MADSKQHAHIDLDAESVINDPGPGFLGNLQAAPSTSTMRQYAYRGAEQFLHDTRSIYDPGAIANLEEYLLITGVNKDTFTRQFLPHQDDRTTTNIFARWCAYDTALELLLIKMPESPAHSAAGPFFNNVLLDALCPMGLTRELATLGAKIRRTPEGAKAPDMCWQPQHVPFHATQGWPSVVLEVAYSETRKKLQSDIRWWLREADGHVKIVLTIAISRYGPGIMLERWERDPANGRIRAIQRLRITRNKRADTVTVVGAPLIIQFEKLFLRAPVTPAEDDIFLNNDDLEHVARGIWKQVDEQGEVQGRQ
ncbi:uncharacterized protein DSM5745_10494 [Aspergillus mulundensis]|uniref:Restriction endonuclease domain-containing protein n=1 Tax=Aspergillus mulundensis TaxID=1810919 RepID=A0A3D8QJ26_9EURO|nr:hypothetical protein DSM5745_10494 [Aspergillus mulundensis]RDW61822.1 hypothetical protein DSM5745_10494 [Aspergillus mulundensis]